MTDATGPSFDRVQNLFEQALCMPAHERDTFLNEACDGDSRLRTEVRSLLDADVPDFLRTGGAQLAASLMAPDSGADLIDAIGPGSLIGEYRLGEQIGAGGMSRVYLAQREGVDFEQRVALKLMRSFGSAREESVRRFRTEQRVLASLSHPNIAQIIDGGITATHRPYLVLEYVDGVSIIDHCRTAALGLTQRLDLFVDVCRAVEHAHQHLVVHRDIKPSNVLVNREGHVKLLDFGIAKLLDETAGTDATRTGLLLLTPDYAAPEQVTGGAITTATDLYALGLVLYELLTDRRPFDTDSKSGPDRMRQICEDEPQKPSTVPGRNSDSERGPARWSHQLRGDLDLIVSKTLAKQPEQRYGSCLELIQDLQRWRDGLPVLAHTPSLAYRANKFARRHWASLGTVTLVSGIVVLFIAALLDERRATRSERDRAQQAEAATGALNRFLVSELLGAASPQHAQGQDLRVSDVLDRAALSAARAFQGQPQLEASVRETLGQTYMRLGRFDEAQQNLGIALAYRQQTLPADHPDRLRMAMDHASLALARGDYDAAHELIKKTYETQSRALGDKHLQTLQALDVLARVQHRRGDWPAAEANLKTVIAGLDAAHPDAWRERQQALSALAAVYHDQRRIGEVSDVLDRLLTIQRERLGDTHPDVIDTMSRQSNNLQRLQRYDDALALAELALVLGRRVYGEQHPDTSDLINRLGHVHLRSRRYTQAHDLFRDAVDGYTKTYGGDHPTANAARSNLAVALHYLGRYEEAESVYRLAAKYHEQLNGKRHPDTIRVLKNLTGNLRLQGKTDAHRKLVEEIVAVAHSYADDDSADPIIVSDMAEYLLLCNPADLRDPATALAMARRAVERSDRLHGEPLMTLALALHAHGRLEEAIVAYEEAASLPSAFYLHAIPRNLAQLYRQTDDPERAERFFKAHLERRRGARSEDDPLIGRSLLELSRFYIENNRAELAEPLARDAIAQFRKTLDEDSALVMRARAALGAALSQQERYADAHTLLFDAFERLRADLQTATYTKLEIAGWIASMHAARGQDHEAEQWRAQIAAHQDAPLFAPW